MEIILLENHFELLPQRAVYWKEKATLIISDLHFGKTAHFRKAGIAIPADLFATDLQTLHQLVITYQPEKLIVVGDMFHSDHNHEIEKFGVWRSTQSQLQIHLAKGNHDILQISKYNELNIVVNELYNIGPFNFSHHYHPVNGHFCFSGHIHPGVLIHGRAHQSLKLPCFHFTDLGCTLPAFSKFTGLALVQPMANDKVYAIVENTVILCLPLSVKNIV